VPNRIAYPETKLSSVDYWKVMKKEGRTYTRIAESLNKQGFKTGRGCKFYVSQVWRLETV
jgi:hypothetical protein